MDDPDPLQPRSPDGSEGSEAAERARLSMARVRVDEGGSRPRGARGSRGAAAERIRDHRTADAAVGSEERSRARASVSPASLRRSWRPIQRDVRVGQLFHPGRSASRRRTAACTRHGRQLHLRNRALRHDPECQPDLLSDALAAAVSDSHDPGFLCQDAGSCLAQIHVAGHRSVLPLLDDG